MVIMDPQLFAHSKRAPSQQLHFLCCAGVGSASWMGKTARGSALVCWGLLYKQLDQLVDQQSFLGPTV